MNTQQIHLRSDNSKMNTQETKSKQSDSASCKSKESPIFTSATKSESVMRRFIVTGPPPPSAGHKKGVLSTELLEHVTAQVRKDVVEQTKDKKTETKFPSGKETDSQSNTMTTKVVAEDDLLPVIEIDSNPAQSGSTNLFSTNDTVTDAVEGDTEVDPYLAELDNDPFDNMDVSEVFCKTTYDVKESTLTDTEQVIDLSPLFSGDLEKWRKRELKKEKKNLLLKHFNRKKKKKKSDNVDAEEEDSDGEKSGKPMKDKPPSPNYFIAIRIANPEIHTALTDIQSKIISADEMLRYAAIKIPTLHLTVMPMYLTDKDMDRAKTALDLCATNLRQLYHDTPLMLDVQGLGNFRNSVLFAEVRQAEQRSQLQHLATVVEESYLENNIISTDGMSSFKPHITVMKLSRAKGLRKKGVKKIDESFYKDHIEDRFGQQAVGDILLCAMMKKKQADGFYQIEHTAHFGPDKTEDEHITDQPGNIAVDVTEDVQVKGLLENITTDVTEDVQIKSSIADVTTSDNICDSVSESRVDEQLGDKNS